MAYLSGNRQSQNILTKMKSLDPENIFSSLMCCKSSKLTPVGLFKVESVSSKNKKKQISAQIWEI